MHVTSQSDLFAAPRKKIRLGIKKSDAVERRLLTRHKNEVDKIPEKLKANISKRGPQRLRVWEAFSGGAAVVTFRNLCRDGFRFTEFCARLQTLQGKSLFSTWRPAPALIVPLVWEHSQDARACVCASPVWPSGMENSYPCPVSADYSECSWPQATSLKTNQQHTVQTHGLLHSSPSGWAPARPPGTRDFFPTVRISSLSVNEAERSRRPSLSRSHCRERNVYLYASSYLISWHERNLFCLCMQWWRSTHGNILLQSDVSWDETE